MRRGQLRYGERYNRAGSTMASMLEFLFWLGVGFDAPLWIAKPAQNAGSCPACSVDHLHNSSKNKPHELAVPINTTNTAGSLEHLITHLELTKPSSTSNISLHGPRFLSGTCNAKLIQSRAVDEQPHGGLNSQHPRGLPKRMANVNDD